MAEDLSHDATPTGAVVTPGEIQPSAVIGRHPAPDPLTGLAGRQALVEHLRDVLAGPDPPRRNVVVVGINIDRFRAINALYGATIGDRVLCAIGERLRSAVRAIDLVARLGADEFAVIAAAPAPFAAEAEAMASRLLQLARQPIALGTEALGFSARAGVIAGTDAYAGPDEVLCDLDLALRQAKAQGSGEPVVWRPARTGATIRRYALAEQLRQAFDNGELILHYQPILRLDDGRMIGAEALLRWNHASDGLVGPAVFMPALEESGLVIPVGNWVIRETCRQLERWQMLYGRDIVEWLGVNLSARQLRNPSHLLATLRAIHESGFALHRLKLEIIEAAWLADPVAAARLLAELPELGIGIAIDDFAGACVVGGDLRRHRADLIKINVGFLTGLGGPEGGRMLPALLEMAGRCGPRIVAKAIETPAQRDRARRSGCDLGQGYLFAEPMDGALFGAYALTHAIAGPRAKPPDDGSRGD